MAASDTDERDTDLSSDDERGFFQMAESDEGNYATTHSLLQPSKGCVDALIRGRLKSVQKRCVAKFMRFRRHSVENACYADHGGDCKRSLHNFSSMFS